MDHGKSWLVRAMSETAWFIRSFIYPDDYPKVYELWMRAGSGIHQGRSDTPEQIARKIERDPDLFLVAEMDGRVIGSVLGGSDGRRGLVYHLAVDESYRQRGIGAALMEELEARLSRKGCLRCYLLVTKENRQAMRFYSRRGWERMDLFIYGKDLG